VCSPRNADIEYLRILRQAARTMESEVERVLQDLLHLDIPPRWNALMEFIGFSTFPRRSSSATLIFAHGARGWNAQLFPMDDLSS